MLLNIFLNFSEMEHDRLQRTHSEEPRSPRSIATPPPRSIATPPPRSLATPPPRPLSTPPESTAKKQVTIVDNQDVIYPSSALSAGTNTSRSNTPSATLPRRQSTPSMDLPKLPRDHSQEYFRQNFQFIHTDDRDDTIDEHSLVQDMQKIQQSMELNQKNLDYLQQKIAAQQMLKVDYGPIAKAPVLPTQGVIQKQTSGQLSKTSTLQSENSVSTETSQTTTTTTDTEKMEKEIFIDFEPQINAESPLVLRRAKKRMLQKTLSEGEILIDR